MFCHVCIDLRKVEEDPILRSDKEHSKISKKSLTRVNEIYVPQHHIGPLLSMYRLCNTCVIHFIWQNPKKCKGDVLTLLH